MFLKPHCASLALVTGLFVGYASANPAETVATLSQVSGLTLINQEADYVTATPGMALREGDRMMAMDGASATITFQDGCVYQLPPNSVLTVGGPESCSAGTLAAAKVGPVIAQAAPAVDGFASPGLIAAGVLGTVVIVGAASNTGSDNRTVPTTPTLSP
jgi:hypothetical protein